MKTWHHIARVTALACAAALAPTAVAQFEDPLVPGELMVRVQSPAQLAACVAALQQFAPVSVVDSIDSRQTYLIGYALGPGESTDQVTSKLDQLQSAGTILWGELNYEGQAGEGKTGSLWVSQLDIGATQYQNQYALPLLGIPAAHAQSTGLNVWVAVLDTGIDATHPDLATHVASLGANFASGAAIGTDVGDGIDNDGDGVTDEMVGHGTFVAGLIALVAPDARIMPVTVLDSEGIGDAFIIAKGMYWAIDNGADIINISLGSTYHSICVEEAAAEAKSKGIPVFAAAGNLNTDDPREYPACDSNAFGVAALDGGDVKAPFSNFEQKLDFSAPGHSESMLGNPKSWDPSKSIISTLPGGAYGAWKGTSFATAFVSATAALVRAQHPTWPDVRTPVGAIADQIVATMETSVVDVDNENPQYQGELGFGRIDALAAVQLGPPQPKLGDLDGDGVVSAADISLLLGAWGACSGTCAADLDGDGAVGASDLALMLGAWGS